MYYNILTAFPHTEKGEEMTRIVSSELKVKASQELLDSIKEDLEKEQRRSIGSLIHEQEEESDNTDRSN